MLLHLSLKIRRRFTTQRKFTWQMRCMGMQTGMPQDVRVRQHAGSQATRHENMRAGISHMNLRCVVKRRLIFRDK